MKKVSSVAIEAGERMRILRRSMRKTQSEMAGFLGISFSTYSKAEVGVRSLPAPALKLLCSHCGIDTDWVLHGTGPGPDMVGGVRLKKGGRRKARGGGASMPDADTATVSEHQPEDFPTLAAAVRAIAEQLEIPISPVRDAILKCLQERDAKVAGECSKRDTHVRTPTMDET